jgi:mRNA interferase RelE/StbE
MAYKVVISKSAAKEIKELSKDYQATINDKIESLKTNPYPNGYKKLKGSKDLFRFRVGDYRVIYKIINNELIIEVVKVGHRRDIYDN